MRGSLFSKVEPHWWTALAVAAAGHVGVMAMILDARADAAPSLPETVMVVELSAGAPPAAAPVPQPVAADTPQQEFAPPVTPRVRVPEVAAPLPADPVTLPNSRPVLQAITAPIARPRPAATNPASSPATYAPPREQAAGSGTVGGGPGDSAEAKQAEGDWYALISAHLNRNKRYPREAKKAEQQGTPVVSFSVDRRGRVSDVTIRTTSGHDVLDAATLELMQRVSPLPAMPRSMGRDRVTITLPIEYSLSRK